MSSKAPSSPTDNRNKRSSSSRSLAQHPSAHVSRSPRPTPVTPDAATATLIGQLVATDMARQDHKDKSQQQSSPVSIKQRPPPPHRTHSQPKNDASPSPSLAQHLQQRASVVVPSSGSVQSPRSRSTAEDRKPAAVVVTPQRPAALLYASLAPPLTHPHHTTPTPQRSAALSKSSTSLDHHRMMEEKRRTRDTGVTMTPRPLMHRPVSSPPTFSQDAKHRPAGPTLAMVRRPTATRPTVQQPSMAPDEALQHAKAQERGPQLAMTRRRRTDTNRTQPSLAAAASPPEYPPARRKEEDHVRRTKEDHEADEQEEEDDDSAYALAMARSHCARLQDKLLREQQEQASAGPSLATPTGGAEIHPGGVAWVGPEVQRKSVPAAAAGVPLVGAFAVQGLAAPSDDSDDSDDDDDDLSQPDVGPDHDIYLHAAGRPEERPGLDLAAPLEAEVYEQVVVDGAIADDEDAEEETLDPKTMRRMRVVQLTILGLALLAVGIIIGSILGFASPGGPSDNGPPPVLGWQPVGSMLFGANTETPQTLFGAALAISADGQRLAVAAPGTDNGTALNVGAVYILDAYQNENGTNWRTSTVLAGPGPSSEAHTALAMAPEALAVGYSRKTQGRPVQLFSLAAEDEGLWSAQSNPPVFNASDDAWWGYAVDLSSDGTVLAVGAPRLNGPYGTSSGVVQVFQKLSNTSWIPMGLGMYGTTADEFFGWTVSLSAGPRLAVGAPVYNDTTGAVRVFDFVGDQWLPVGGALFGEVPLGRFGESVALSGDGSVLAVGARGSVFDEGQVKMFRERNGQWIMDETSLRGQEAGEGFGASVALSVDGGTLAVGAPQSNTFGESTGAISVYRFSNQELWKQHGSAIGSAQVSEYGSSVALSDDGLRVAGGAPTTSYDGSISRAGCVMVYDLVEMPSRRNKRKL